MSSPYSQDPQQGPWYNQESGPGQQPPMQPRSQVPPWQPNAPGTHQPYPQHTVYVNADNSNNTSLAPVTSLVTGLIGFFIAWIPIVGIAAWVFGPLALVFGILGLRRGKAEHKIMSVIGIIAGAVALVWCVVYLFLFVISLASSADS